VALGEPYMAMVTDGTPAKGKFWGQNIAREGLLERQAQLEAAIQVQRSEQHRLENPREHLEVIQTEETLSLLKKMQQRGLLKVHRVLADTMSGLERVAIATWRAEASKTQWEGHWLAAESLKETARYRAARLMAAATWRLQSSPLRYLYILHANQLAAAAERSQLLVARHGALAQVVLVLSELQGNLLRVLVLSWRTRVGAGLRNNLRSNMWSLERKAALRAVGRALARRMGHAKRAALDSMLLNMSLEFIYRPKQARDAVREEQLEDDCLTGAEQGEPMIYEEPVLEPRGGTCATGVLGCGARTADSVSDSADAGCFMM